MHNKSECAKHDELEAILHTARYFYDNGYELSSQRWYAKAISKSIMLEKRCDVVNLFNQYFLKHEKKQLLKKQNAKIRIKWMALTVPVFFAMVRFIKKTA